MLNPVLIATSTDPLARFRVKVRELLPAGRAFSAEAALEALAYARGSVTPDDVASFKMPLPPLHNPFPEVPQSELALARIRRAIAEQHKVVVLGDYDVDGIISTVLIFELLLRAGLKAGCFIPDRIEDDYGVTQKALEKCLSEHAPSLIISVDCGSPSLAVISAAKELGVDFIVLDHHEPVASRKPHPAFAHLNPKAWRGSSPMVDEATTLCAGGLSFFFAEYLAQALAVTGWSRDRALILAGIATVADVMPLTRTNRGLVQHSVALAEAPGGRALVPGLSLLLERASASTFSAKTYGWVIGPHLNASGRVSHARVSANLVASRNPAVISAGVDELIATNRDRKAIQDTVHEEAMLQAEEQIATNPHRRFLVLFGEDWHPGVVGIVAGRVRERFQLPAIVCGMHPEHGYWKGSARGVRGSNLGHIVHAAVKAEVMLAGGGHMMAAGIKVAPGREEAVRSWLESHVANMAWDTHEVLDVLGHYSALKAGAWETLLARAGPFGNENPEPVMMLRQAVFSGELRPLKVRATGRVFGLSFGLLAGGRNYDVSWIGLSAESELLAAETFLREKSPTDFAVRQVTRVKNGVTYVNLDLAGIVA